MKQSIVGKHWIHSHEEDSASEMIFRPVGYNFPRSRGRSGFELNADGSAVTTGPAPTDAPQQVAADWSMTGENMLEIKVPSTQETKKYHIVSSTPDRLVVSKTD